MSEKQGLPVDNSASPQTIPPTALRDIPGALSFSTLLPKSPGQLLLEFYKYEIPELNSHKVTQARRKNYP